MESQEVADLLGELTELRRTVEDVAEAIHTVVDQLKELTDVKRDLLTMLSQKQ